MSMSQDQARLRELYNYRLLHTESEPELGMIVKHIARRFKMPIALVSLVDEERQWFMTKHGLDVDETSRAVSFCDHVVQSKQPMTVEDARQDERFAQNPLVTEGLEIKSYVGAPLTTQNGFVLGALCMIDNTQTRQFSEDEVELLKVFARCVMSHFEVRHARAIAEREIAHDHFGQENAAKSLTHLARDIRRDIDAIQDDSRVIAKRSKQDLSADLQIIESSNHAVTRQLDELDSRIDEQDQ